MYGIFQPLLTSWYCILKRERHKKFDANISTTVSCFYVRLFNFFYYRFPALEEDICVYIFIIKIFVIQNPVRWMQLRSICLCKIKGVREMKSQLKSATLHFTEAES